mgnify:CR=1 FL=1
MSWEQRKLEQTRVKFRVLETQQFPRIAHDLADNITKSLEVIGATPKMLDPAATDDYAVRLRIGYAVVAADLLVMMGKDSPPPDDAAKSVRPSNPDLNRALALSLDLSS